jgi:hypothetical protein
MAVVAQLVEHRIVIPVVVGSIPIHRPNKSNTYADFPGGLISRGIAGEARE